jgi:hypothetical protein
MLASRGWIVAACVAIATFALLAPAASEAHASEPAPRLPCVFYNPDLGQYGAWVFRLLDRPSKCTEYLRNEPCHCTEAPLTGVRWHHWGSRRAVGVGFWHYCGSGACIYRRAHLVASRRRFSCGPVYTRLEMRLPRRTLHGHPLHRTRKLFHLPACGGPFE